jgi:hypothetical protein
MSKIKKTSINNYFIFQQSAQISVIDVLILGCEIMAIIQQVPLKGWLRSARLQHATSLDT